MRGILIATVVVAVGAGALAAAGWLAESPDEFTARSAEPAAPAETPLTAQVAEAVAPATSAALPTGPAVPVPAVEQQALLTPAPTAPAAAPQPAVAAPAAAPTVAPPTAAAVVAAATPAAPQVVVVVPGPTGVPAAAAPIITPPPGPQAALAPPAAPPPAATPPTFDVVRINPQGRAVIAGRALPHAEITINASAEIVAVTRADAFGEWVAIPDNPLPRGPRELSLQALAPNGERLRSEQIVTVVIPGNGATAEERTIAVLQDRGGTTAPRLLQGAITDPGARGDTLTLDAVQYDEAGNVVLAGKARLGTQVQVFVDDRPVGFAAADQGGLWQMTPDDTLAIGRHQLRLEQVDPAGVLVARMELPFLRAAPEAIRAMAPGEVIVQPGNTLWRIARNAYGRGTLYTVIYLANAEQITNPDLIYPGQIFRLPTTKAQ
ncbi:MAG: LysM peptidoglycan-binding domain-containing protein [Alphaproteobacteria bacterium]|nr:LysM peptidoglycan-binding domain-containing protein [Alphaproteobacteria bacterium]